MSRSSRSDEGARAVTTTTRLRTTDAQRAQPRVRASRSPPGARSSEFMRSRRLAGGGRARPAVWAARLQAELKRRVRLAGEWIKTGLLQHTNDDLWKCGVLLDDATSRTGDDGAAGSHRGPTSTPRRRRRFCGGWSGARGLDSAASRDRAAGVLVHPRRRARLGPEHSAHRATAALRVCAADASLIGITDWTNSIRVLVARDSRAAAQRLPSERCRQRQTRARSTRTAAMQRRYLEPAPVAVPRAT